MELMVAHGWSDAGRFMRRQRMVRFGFLILPPRDAGSGQARACVSPALSVDTSMKPMAAGRKADAGLADVDSQAGAGSLFDAGSESPRRIHRHYRESPLALPQP